MTSTYLQEVTKLLFVILSYGAWLPSLVLNYRAFFGRCQGLELLFPVVEERQSLR